MTLQVPVVQLSAAQVAHIREAGGSFLPLDVHGTQLEPIITEKEPVEVADKSPEAVALEAELRIISERSIPALTAMFNQSKASVGGLLPPISIEKASADLQTLQARKGLLAHALAQMQSVQESASQAQAPISHQAKGLMDYYRTVWEKQKQQIGVAGLSGPIYDAGQIYARIENALPADKRITREELLGHLQNNTGPEDADQKRLLEAFKRFHQLNKTLILMTQYADLAEHYLAAPNVATLSSEHIATLDMVIAQIIKQFPTIQNEFHEKDRHISYLMKVCNALNAQQQLSALDAKRRSLESRLAQLQSLRPAVSMPAGSPMDDVKPPAASPVTLTAMPSATPNPVAVAEDFTSVGALIKTYNSKWNPVSKIYEDVPFDVAEFTKVAEAHNGVFLVPYDPSIDFGHIEKKVVNPGTKIFVRADLHGDLKSLVENLNVLQAAGLLNETFRCNPDVQLVFLGDYADRGSHSMQVLQVLLTLRMENPHQVTLIRGNHEKVDMNIGYCGSDDWQFRAFFHDEHYTLHHENVQLLDEVYKRMPLTVFIGEETPSKRIQYAAFTHGIFEFYIDPYDLLNSESRMASLPVPKAVTDSKHGTAALLSDRVRTLAQMASSEDDYEKILAETTDKTIRKRLKQEWAAYRVNLLAHIPRSSKFEALTAYNWGDVRVPNGTKDSDRSILGDLGARNWKASTADIKHYFRLISSEAAKVKFLFRGHEHAMHHLLRKGKLLITTMPVGMDSRAYKEKFAGQLDVGYILTTAPTIGSKTVDSQVKSGWTKQAMQRVPGESSTIVRATCPIRNTDV